MPAKKPRTPSDQTHQEPERQPPDVDDPIWNAFEIAYRMNTRSEGKRSEKGFPGATEELEDWRRSFFSPGIVQSLEDIEREMLPTLAKKGVNVDAVKAVLHDLVFRRIPDVKKRRGIQGAIDALYDGAAAVDRLARCGLLPGRATREVGRSVFGYTADVRVLPTMVRRRMKVVTTKQLMKCLIDLLKPIGADARETAEKMLAELGFQRT